MAAHSSLLTWSIHGQRGLVGYSPWGRKESGTTEWLSTHKPCACCHIYLALGWEPERSLMWHINDQIRLDRSEHKSENNWGDDVTLNPSLYAPALKPPLFRTLWGGPVGWLVLCPESQELQINHSYIFLLPVSQNPWPGAMIKGSTSLLFSISGVGYASEHVGSSFPNQGLNPCPLRWKHGVLTTGSPRNSPVFLFYDFCSLAPRNDIFLVLNNYEKCPEWKWCPASRVPKAMVALGDIPRWGQLTPTGSHRFTGRLRSQYRTPRYAEDCRLHKVYVSAHHRWIHPQPQPF